MTNPEDIMSRAIAARCAQGLSVEVTDEYGTYVRHCRDYGDRDAFIERRRAAGQQAVIMAITPEGER